MTPILFRCSSLGKIMAEPKSIEPGLITEAIAEVVAKKKRTEEETALLRSLKDQTLSEGAKAYIRSLAKQDILSVDFTFGSKETAKGTEVEDQSIALLNRVRGLSLVKNTERRTDGLITGECDLFDGPRRRGHDLKSSWSAQTFPGWVDDCEDALYEWQMRGYMKLWDADEWEVNYALVDTPERLIGYEDLSLHIVGHIPEHHRLTSWVVKRDLAKEALIATKVRIARNYYAQVVMEFDAAHAANNTPALLAA